MFAGLLKFSLLLAAPLAAWANPHGSAHHNRHVEIAKRQGGDVQLFKRFSSARWTYYAVGLGACGITNVPSDFIVALNSAQFGSGYPGPNCFKTITMSYNGKTTQATITDECPGCPYGGLDLSTGLFTFFAAESVGVLYGTWSFNDGSGGSDDTPTTSTYVPPKTTTKHTTTSTWSPTPTTYWTPDPTTSTTKKTTTSTSTSTSHSTSSTSTSHSSSASSSSTTHSTSSSTSTSASSSAPSATPSSTTQASLNLASLSESILQLGVLIVAAV